MAPTVLIVDDHPSRATARTLHEAEDCDVVGEAARSAAAIDCAGRPTPDVNLPGLDGFAVAEQLGGHAVVEVTDDGVGGADPSRGSGPRGLADRIPALDGRLAVESVPGAGTTVRAQLVIDRAVEGPVTSTSSKRDLLPTQDDHRRVLAVLAFPDAGDLP